ncbi:DUF4040 domain-containing protein [Anaplasmataceae bacterium AB001_6]|nr:DUF4040 domain-containing protein [Anaplasmataceae bacterium AB001_6]
MNQIFLLIILLLILVCVVSIIFINKTLKIILVASFISFLVVLYYIFSNSPDVAMTEVAVGSVMSTMVLLFGYMYDKKSKKINIKKFYIIIPITILFYIVVLFFVSLKIPTFGNISNYVNGHNYQYYCDNVHENFGFNNIATSILAGYRGFDTMCETIVVFIAGISIFLILKEDEE